MGFCKQERPPGNDVPGSSLEKCYMYITTEDALKQQTLSGDEFEEYMLQRYGNNLRIQSTMLIYPPPETERT